MAVATCKHSATRNEEEEISKLDDFFSPDNIEWPRAPIETQHTDPSSAATSIQEERVERTALTAATQPTPTVVFQVLTYFNYSAQPSYTARPRLALDSQ